MPRVTAAAVTSIRVTAAKIIAAMCMVYEAIAESSKSGGRNKIEIKRIDSPPAAEIRQTFL